MKACATQRSANLKFVEQMEKRTIHHVMLKHKEFEFTILEIVSLITSWTCRVTLYKMFIYFILSCSEYKKGSVCNLISASCKNVTCMEPFIPPDSCCRICGKLSVRLPYARM